MAVAFDAKTAAVTEASGVSTLSLTNLTVGSGSNRAMAILIFWSSGASVPTVTACNWDSAGTPQAMTLIANTNAFVGGSSIAVSAYGLIAPTSGNKTLKIDWTGSFEAHAVAISFTGVDQTNVATAFPHGTTNLKTSSTASPCSVTITSATGNMAVGGHCQQSVVWGAISDNTIASSAAGPAQGNAFNYAAGAATKTLTAAFSGSDTWSSFGFDVLASGGAATKAMPIFGQPLRIISRRSF